ncbi:hypothetical protein E2553_32340 [Paraburkholderia dipogonis]|uniref:Uncharacterized protein n=1 Tax=Paraburkholderia dipogonis TaxID=1211383 RepID=A0A4Y8MVH1_9BURK|nr:hypothetical protein E2553_32340 [Paraburkholderia dipogonis]
MIDSSPLSRVLYPQTVQASRPGDIAEGPTTVSTAATSAAAPKNTHRLHGTRVNPYHSLRCNIKKTRPVRTSQVP